MKVEQATLNFLPQDGTQSVELSTTAATEQPVETPAATEQACKAPPIFAVTKGNIGTAVPWTGDQIAQELDDPKLHANVEEVRAETDEAKQKALKEQKKFEIIGICPHFKQFRNNHRAANEAIPESCTYETNVDVDDRAFGQQAIEGALRLNSEPGMWKDKVLYIENSLRGGGKCHIWLIQPVGMTPIETQQAFCKALGIPCDDSVQQKQSFILMTGDAVYKSPRWLKPLTPEEIEARRTAFQLRGLSIDGWDKAPTSKTSPATTAQSEATTVAQPVDSNIAVTPRLRYIFDQFVSLTGQPEGNLRTENYRHNMVKAVLSVGADKVMSEAEFRACLLEKMGDYSQDKDISRLVSDFYSKYNEPAQRFTRDQLRIMSDAQRKFPLDNTPQDEADGINAGQASAPVYGDIATLDEIYASPTPPQRSPKANPAFVKAATAPVPKDGKDTAAQVMFPPLGMYCDASFVYDDGTPREPRGNGLIIAGTGGGKDNTTKFMLKHLEMPRQLMDEPNRKILADWKAEYKRKEGKNEDKPPRPENVAVRSVASDITKARLSELMADSEGRIIHTRMIEFDQWFGVEGWKPGPNCPFTNLKLTDDEDNPFGQERVGKDSITYRGPLSINWNSSTTVSKALYYFRNSMIDGPISRLTLATAPIRGLGAPMPKHGKYDEKYDASLRPFIDNLCKAKGVITCKPAIKLVQRLKKELDEYSIKSGDDVFDNLGHRALVAAFRKACLLYAANGMNWERSIERFCRWSLHYDLWLKLSIFGDAIRSADGEVKTSRRGPRNLLAQLGQVFDRPALVNARQANGMKEEGTDNQLSQWKHRGYIEELPDGTYRKVMTDDK